MNIRKYTATGRPVDPDYATNKAIMIITLVVLAGGFVYRMITGSGILPAIGWGFGAAFSVFLSWAVCREIDPDHDLSAFVAAGLTLVGIFFYYPPDFIGTFWLLSVLRVVNRTTGLRPYIQDSVVVSLLSAWLMFEGYWIYGLITIAAFAVDYILDHKIPQQMYFSLVNALFFLIIWILRGYRSTLENFPLTFPVIPVLIVILFLPLVVSYRKVTSTGDDTGEPLEPVRIMSAQILALFVGVQLYLQSGYAPMIPLYGAITGSLIYFYGSGAGWRKSRH